MLFLYSCQDNIYRFPCKLVEFNRSSNLVGKSLISKFKMSLPGHHVSGAPVLRGLLSSIVGPPGIRIQAGMNAGTHRRGGPSFYFP